MSGEVSHDFALNMNPNDPEVFGVAGIENAYVNAIQSGIQLYGPTNFAPIIQKAMTFAEAAQKNVSNKYQYFILLILTDGVITVNY